jgi:hypothetical protein
MFKEVVWAARATETKQEGDKEEEKGNKRTTRRRKKTQKEVKRRRKERFCLGVLCDAGFETMFNYRRSGFIVTWRAVSVRSVSGATALKKATLFPATIAKCGNWEENCRKNSHSCDVLAHHMVSISAICCRRAQQFRPFDFCHGAFWFPACRRIGVKIDETNCLDASFSPLLKLYCF